MIFYPSNSAAYFLPLRINRNKTALMLRNKHIIILYRPAARIRWYIQILGAVLDVDVVKTITQTRVSTADLDRPRQLRPGCTVPVRIFLRAAVDLVAGPAI